MSRSNLSILEGDILTITIPETALPDKFLSKCMRGPEPIVVPTISDLVNFTASARDIHTILENQLTWKRSADEVEDDEVEADEEQPADTQVYSQLEAHNLCHSLFPSLSWLTKDGYLVAVADQDFQDLFRANEQSLIAVGFTMHEVQDPHLWRVRFHYNVPTTQTQVLWAVMTARQKVGDATAINPRKRLEIMDAAYRIAGAANALLNAKGAARAKAVRDILRGSTEIQTTLGV